MDNVNKLPEKGQRLKKYLDSKEQTEILLLDLLRSKELSQKDYERMIQDSESAYRQFLNDLKRPPIDDNQIQIPFEKEED